MKTTRALLVDDDESWFKIFRLLCADRNIPCKWAPTVLEARRLLASSQFDILILDLGFPDRSDRGLPADIDDIDLLIASLQTANKPHGILICTGMNDWDKLRATERRLCSPKRTVQVVRKGTGADLDVLTDALSKVTMKPSQPRAVAMTRNLTVAEAMLALLVTFAVMIGAVVGLGDTLRNSGGDLVVKLVVGIIGYTLVIFSLLILYTTGVFSSKQLHSLLIKVVDAVAKLRLNKKDDGADKKPDDDDEAEEDDKDSKK